LIVGLNVKGFSTKHTSSVSDPAHCIIAPPLSKLKELHHHRCPAVQAQASLMLSIPDYPPFRQGKSSHDYQLNFQEISITTPIAAQSSIKKKGAYTE
jgi:hypothetical protein